MRKILVSVFGVLAMLMGSVALATPAHADDDPPAGDYSTFDNGDYGINALPKPSTITGNMFWTGNLCVQSPLNATTWPVAAMAQQYNIRVGNTAVLALNFRADCEASGYTPSRSMTITAGSAGTTSCSTGLNTERALYNGMYRWTNHPVMVINTNIASCFSSQPRRNHIISASIGQFLGLHVQNSSGYNSRVMNMTTYSWDNVPTVSSPEGDLVWSIYTKAYGG